MRKRTENAVIACGYIVFGYCCLVLGGCLLEEREAPISVGDHGDSAPPEKHEDLFCLENGHLLRISPTSEWLADDVFLTRFVFDEDLLKPAYEAWKSKRFEAKRVELLREIGWYGDPKADRLVWVSCIFQQVAKEQGLNPIGGEDGTLVELIMGGRVWRFVRPVRRGGQIRREDLSDETAARIKKYFWPAFRDGRPRENVLFDWHKPSGSLYIPAVLPSARENAGRRVRIDWNGRTWEGVTIGYQQVTVPGIGVVATGDFREGVGGAVRYPRLCVVSVVLPKKRTVIVDPTMSLRVIIPLPPATRIDGEKEEKPTASP